MAGESSLSWSTAQSRMAIDHRLREQLAAWLEFYRDLGIEEFYRREPGAQPAGVAAREKPPGASAVPAPSPQPVETGNERVPARVGPSLAASPSRAAPPPPGAPRVSINAPAPTLSLFEVAAKPHAGPETLEQIRADLGDCHRCRLADRRKTIVFGEGDSHARLVFVGEGPGADEDEQGRPFVGRAGQLLNRMIQLIGMKREEVYICNVVKCRPPENRTPEKDEIEACSPFLLRQMEALQPRLICLLGAPAMRTVLGVKEGITRVRGRFFDYGGTKAFVTFHPAYILRNPREEKILREDFETIRDFLSALR